MNNWPPGVGFLAIGVFPNNNTTGTWPPVSAAHAASFQSPGPDRSTDTGRMRVGR